MRRLTLGVALFAAALLASACDAPIAWNDTPIGFGATPPPAITSAATCTPPPIGTSTGSESIGGWNRTWRMYTPAAVCQRQNNAFVRLPIVLALHGANETGASFVDDTQLTALADSQGFIAIFPDAYQGSWNDGRANVNSTAHQQNIDDVAFLLTLVDRLVSGGAGDSHRVYAIGFSNGAMMANRLGCDRTNRVAAAVLVGGYGPGDPALGSICQPDRPLALAVLSSTNDPIVPYNGGEILTPTCSASCGRGTSASAAQWLSLWSTRNGCTGSTSAALGGTTYAGAMRVTYSGCAAALEHDKLTDPFHEWYGKPGAHELLYKATNRAWDFVRARSR